jgi:hypothetical protein
MQRHWSASRAKEEEREEGDQVRLLRKARNMLGITCEFCELLWGDRPFSGIM